VESFRIVSFPSPPRGVRRFIPADSPLHGNLLRAFLVRGTYSDRYFVLAVSPADEPRAPAKRGPPIPSDVLEYSVHVSITTLRRISHRQHAT
jgi:hypothetical protein